ncbi:ClbS/DfsB family four-helix bundle protein [Solibacillus sp. FSL H8-0523]|uniref:ClbS/DfsB family four-helix bundle protein n=1 Tax=Solibacillus sp. FSL H8-0523 TaxID=2954511 RepID=UPI0031016DB2
MTTIHSKEHFLAEIQESFEQIFTIIDSVPTRKRKLTVEIESRDRNFRDVLMHLYEWHAMLERWYKEGMSGDTPSMPAPGYQWRTLQKLNYQIWINYQDVTLTQAMKRVKLSHQRIVKLIEMHTYDEIMTKKMYKWTKTSNLYSYFAANTVDHYNWAIQKCTAIEKKIIESDVEG